MLRVSEITWLSDPVKSYADALRKAQTLAELRDAIERFGGEFALDAMDKAAQMSMADFAAFRRGLLSETRGRFAGWVWSKRFGAIVRPEIMLGIEMIAAELHAPWGTACLRLRDSGALYYKDGWMKLEFPKVKA